MLNLNSMAIFLKQTDQRSQLQSRIAADLDDRAVSTSGGDDINKSKMLEDTKEATGKSLFWVGVVAMVVIAAVIFLVFIYEG